MAKFYLNDFPKTPSAVPQAPIGATPAERKGGPPGYAQINARVANIDIAKNIPSLMQQGLPENLSNALVGGKLRVGNAWANAAESLGEVAETAGKIAAHLANSKNAADESRVSNLIKTSDMAFAEKAEQERWTLQQQLEIAPSWHQKLDEDIAGLGLSPENADKAQTDLYLHHARQRTELTHALRLEQEESDRTAMTTDIENSVAAGDIERAMMLNERMLDANLQSKGQRDSRKIKIENTYQEQKAAEIVALSPRASIPELEKLKRGGTSAQFPELKNKASIDRLLQDAYQTNHKQEVEAAREIDAGVKNRTIKNKDDISNISKGRLPQHVVDALAADLTSEIPLDYEKIADISRAIDAYPGAKVDKTYQQDHELRQRILTEVPKAAEGEKNGLREQLLDRLDKRHKTLEENSLKPAEAERDRIVSEAKDYTKDGLMFGDPRPPRLPWLNWGYTPGKGWGYTSERPPAPLDKLKTAEEKNKIWKRYDDAVHALDEFLRTKPDATVDEVRDKWNKIVYPDARNSAVERVKEKAKGMPANAPSAAPVTSSLGGKLRGKEHLFANAAARAGVDPNLLVAIANHETGRGTSDFLKSFNNPGGLMDPATDWLEPQRFASLEEGVDAMARNLKENYIDKGLTTIEQIGPEYAPVGAPNDRGQNKDWIAGVKSFYNQGTGKTIEVDQRSAEQIASLKPEAQGVMQSFISRAKAWAKENGLDVFISEGYRSPERQAELYAQGRTKPGPIVTNAKPGKSNHQSGRAVDVVITRNGKVVDQKKVWQQLARIGKEMGLEWGGDFRSIYDPEHFQVPA